MFTGLKMKNDVEFSIIKSCIESKNQTKNLLPISSIFQFNLTNHKYYFMLIRTNRTYLLFNVYKNTIFYLIWYLFARKFLNSKRNKFLFIVIRLKTNFNLKGFYVAKISLFRWGNLALYGTGWFGWEGLWLFELWFIKFATNKSILASMSW
jgi:hypothetical protein